MKKILLTLILLIAPFVVETSEKIEVGGLSFYSNKYETPEKTRYDVFVHSRKFPKDVFGISFDMELTGRGTLGYVFTCKNEQTDQFNLKVCYKKLEKEYDFLLHLRFAGKKLCLEIPEDYLGRNIWRKCSINMSLRDGKVSLSVGEYSASMDFNPEYQCSEHQKVRYVFGRCDYNVDVLAFSLRNVNVQEDGYEQCFPLCEVSGTDVHSSRGKAVGTVFNPDWLYGKHYSWELCGEFPEKEISAVFYDDSLRQVLFYTSDVLRGYLMNEDKWFVQEHDFEHPFHVREGGGFNYLFDRKTGDCLMFNNTAPQEEARQPVIYNYRKNTISYPPGELKTVAKNHHNTAFCDKNFKKYWQMGGVGNFHYRNDIYESSADDLTWKIVQFSGETICPREFMSVASDSEGESGSVYLFGGYGNLTGPKRDGDDFFFDLYQLDLQRRNIRKLADFKDFPETRVPSRDMIIGKDGHSLYVLLYPHFLNDSDAQLYRFDWADGTWTSLGNSIPFNAYKQSTQVHLFEDAQLGYLIAVIQEFKEATQSMVRLYRIRIPVLSDLVPVVAEYSPLSSHWLIIVLVIFLLAGALYFIYRKRRHAEKETSLCPIPDKVEVVNVEDTMEPETKKHKNYIYILGDFSVFDRNGRDITYMFSSKIRQLFLLVFLNSERDSSQGVSSDEISSILWPEKELAKSSNVRGVTMTNLRNVLAELDGIQIVNHQGKWFVEMDYKLCNCDFHIVCNPEIDLYKINDYEEIRPYVHYLRRGLLLKSEEWDWIDPFKSEYEERILTLYTSVMIDAYKKAEYLISYRVSQVLLSIDVLNEDLMRIEINSLLKMGNADKARVKFRIFSINYYEAYNKNLLFEDYIDQ